MDIQLFRDQNLLESTVKLLSVYLFGILCVFCGNVLNLSSGDRVVKLNCLILNLLQTAITQHEHHHLYLALTIYNSQKRNLYVSIDFEKYWEVIHPT